MHPNGDVADAGPGVEPRPQRPERAVVGGHRAPGESECCLQELAALVEHVLLDDLVSSPEQRRRNREAECRRGLEIDHKLELSGLSTWSLRSIDRFAAFNAMS